MRIRLAEGKGPRQRAFSSAWLKLYLLSDAKKQTNKNAHSFFKCNGFLTNIVTWIFLCITGQYKKICAVIFLAKNTDLLLLFITVLTGSEPT